MQALFVILGALVAFTGGYVLQRVNATASARSRIFVELLPPLQRDVENILRVARHSRHISPSPSMRLWPGIHAADLVYQQAVLCGRADLAWASTIRENWLNLDAQIDDQSPLSEQLIDNAAVVSDAEIVAAAAASYAEQLERRFQARGGLGRVRHPDPRTVDGSRPA